MQHIGLMISVMRNCVMSHNYFLTQLPGRINQKFCFYCSFQWDDKIVSGGKVHKTFLSVPTFSAHEWQVLIFWSNLGRTEPFALWNSWREGIAIFSYFIGPFGHIIWWQGCRSHLTFSYPELTQEIMCSKRVCHDFLTRPDKCCK